MDRHLVICTVILCLVAFSQGLIELHREKLVLKNSLNYGERFEIESSPVNKLKQKRDNSDPYSLERALLCSSSQEKDNSTLLSFVKCATDEVEVGSENTNQQHQVVFNSNTNEFLVIFVQENIVNNIAQTSLLGTRVDSNGDPIGQTINIFTYEDDPNIKQNPVVAFNPKDDLYFIVFDYLTTSPEIDQDVGGLIMSSNGTIIVSPFYVGTSYNFPGVDKSPSIAYNSIDDTYVVVYQRTYFGRTDLVIQAMDFSGEPIENPVRFYDGNGANLVSPDIAYNSVRNQFYLVFEFTTGSDFSKLYGIHVNTTGWPMESVPFSVGSESSTRDRNPVIEYSPYQHMYIIAFETEEQGSPGEPTSVQSLRVHGPSGLPENGLTKIGPMGSHQRRPDVAYSQEHDELVIVYENFIGDEGSSVRAAVLDADSFTVYQDVEVTSSKDEFYPSVAFNGQDETLLVVWSRGGPEEKSVKKQDDSNDNKAGVIAGAVIGSVAGVALIGAGLFYLLKKRNQNRKFQEMQEIELNK